MRLRLFVLIVVSASLLELSGCGGEEPQAPPAPPPAAPAAAPPQQPPTAQPQQPPAPATPTPRDFGFGPVTLRFMGTTPKTGPGARYIGDCDNEQPDDDFEVMTFSAPWKIVGSRSGGAGGSLGAPFSRYFHFEKSPDLGQARFGLEFGRELRRATDASLTAGLNNIADIDFGTGSVGLFFVEEIGELPQGYAALFPIAQLEGMPPEPDLLPRYIAQVTFSPYIGSLEGWSQAEIVQLYESLYTERCLGEDFGGALAAMMGAATVYE